MKLKSNFGEQIVTVDWGDFDQYSFNSTVVFTGIDSLGILNKILTKVSEDVVVNIQSLNVSSKDGVFEGRLNVNVHSAEDVNNLCHRIAKVNGVTTVRRLS